MHVFWKFFGAIATIVMVTLMVVALFAAITWRFGLITIKPSFFFFAFGLCLMIGGGLLKLYGQFGGKFFALAGAVLFGIGMYKAVWPNTSAATNNAQEVADLQAALALNNSVAPKVVRCDRESNTMYWDQVTPKLAIVFYAPNKKKRLIECADRKGVNPFTGVEYKPITDEIIALIEKQDPPPSPPPTPAVVVPVTAIIQAPPTPLPQIADVPVAPPANTQPEEFSITAGATFMVALTESIDLGRHGENYQFTAMLKTDIIGDDGVVLAKYGTPVGMRISRLQLGSRSNTVNLEIEVTSLTTTGRTSVPAQAGMNGFYIVRRTRNGFSGGRYVLLPTNIQMTLEKRLTIPATLLADGR